MLNTPQWKEFLMLVRRASRAHKRVDVKWVKGHKDDPCNARADELAKQSAKIARSKAIRPARIRRKKSPNQVEIGSVRMVGQVATIHIVVDEYLPPPHRCYRYMYEIMDEDSPYYQRVDWITSDVPLARGHTYSVQLNDNQGNPRIEELLGEIEAA